MANTPDAATKTSRGLGLAVAIGCVVVIVAAGFLSAIWGNGIDAILRGATGAFSALVVLFLAGLALIVIVKMAKGTIDLGYLIADEEGYTSLSRFQMLLFTFVIAGLYLIYALYALFTVKSGAACPGTLTDQITAVVTAANNAADIAKQDGKDTVIAAANAAKTAADKLNEACVTFSLPSIPATVLGLMGISGGSYLLSKGIQAASGPSDQSGTPSVRRNVNQ